MKLMYLSRSIFPSRYANSINVIQMVTAFSALNNTVFLQGLKGDEDSNLYKYYDVEEKFEFSLLPLQVRFFKIGRYCQEMICLLKFNPDLVYGRNLLGCFLACLLGYPVIFETHHPFEKYNRVERKTLKTLFNLKNFRGLVVISEPLRESYLQNGLNEPSIFLAPDGACVNNSQPTSLGPLNRLQVGYSGHLYSGRGIDLIIELAKRCHWADFHIVGGLEHDINYWKKNSNEVKNITFHGYFPPSKVKPFLKGCDVLLAPYQDMVLTCDGYNSVRWMSPLKIFEYMASGSVIIVSDLPVLKEVLEPDENCMMCNPNKVEEWTSALTILKNNTEFRKKIGASAKKKLTENYLWTTRCENILSKI